MVGAVGGDVDESGDAQHVQHVFSRSVVGTAQVQEGQDLHGTTLRRRTKYIWSIPKQSTKSLTDKTNEKILLRKGNTNLVIQRSVARATTGVCSLWVAGTQRQTEPLWRGRFGTHLRKLFGKSLKSTFI